MNHNNILSTHSSCTNLGGNDDDSNNGQIEMYRPPPPPSVQLHGVFYKPRSHQATVDIQDNRL